MPPGGRVERSPQPAGTVRPLTRMTDGSIAMSGDLLATRAGSVPDRLTIWPVDDGRYGLDATFQGSAGYERARQHQTELERDGVPHAFRQENDGGWTLRFGPLPAADIAGALSAFVYQAIRRRGREGRLTR